jgi:hypothetical protein
MARKYGDAEWNSMDSVKNRAKCFEELLDVARGDWDNFHEDFVCILVKFGYRKYLTVGEKDWYKNEVVNGTRSISIVDYTLP